MSSCLSHLMTKPREKECYLLHTLFAYPTTSIEPAIHIPRTLEGIRKVSCVSALHNH